jgi:hypothetical protein
VQRKIWWRKLILKHVFRGENSTAGWVGGNRQPILLFRRIIRIGGSYVMGIPYRDSE